MFIDAQCLGCGHRFGWASRGDEPPPPCPRCGKPLADLAGDLAELQMYRDWLRSRKETRDR